MKVALLGGTFDPVHNGHIEQANAALEQLGADEVWFIPALRSPLKGNPLTSAGHRINMLKRVTARYPKFKVCDIELKRTPPSYTIDTLEQLKEDFPKTEFVWILGADQALDFDRWKNPERLLELAEFAVASRDGKTGLDSKYKFTPLKMDAQDVSSTEIRAGKKINFLPEEVLQYILDNELYIEFWVKAQVSPSRFAHSCSVARLCRKLAGAHGLDEHKAWLAGMFHDIAKDMPQGEQKKWMQACFPMALEEPHAIWHGYCGSEIVERVYGVHDPVVQNAIASHVKGSSYDPYAMIVYIADKTDPLRGYDSSGLIDACMQDLYNGFMFVKQQNTAYLERERANGSVRNRTESN